MFYKPPKKDFKMRIFRIKFGWQDGQWFVIVNDSNGHLKRSCYSNCNPFDCIGVLWRKGFMT